MNADELKGVLRKHAIWLNNEPGGVWADLRGADLRGADGAFVTGYYGKHHAIAAGGYISIGCERHTYQEWLDNGEQIGKANEYTDAEIADYMDWIRLAIRALERMERKD